MSKFELKRRQPRRSLESEEGEISSLYTIRSEGGTIDTSRPRVVGGGKLRAHPSYKETWRAEGTVRVGGSNVPEAPQDFAIVVLGPLP